MECIPAIDLRGGRSVRLVRGDFAAETAYGDPVAQACRYEKAGAGALHVVDLDGARDGEAGNGAVIAEIIRSVAIPVEVGGGIRTRDRAEELIELGAARIVLGTRAIEEPRFARELAAAFPERVVLGLDYRRQPDGAPGEDREVAVRGWAAGSGRGLLEVVRECADAPLWGVVATDIAVDGTLAGPDTATYALLLGETDLRIVASGGVGSIADLVALRTLEVAGRGLAGVVVGKALVEGAFSVEEAVVACRP
jgi:phosphoribosylformimino-5-aminoimidazole carboxamide ribotide isomerase